MSIKYVNIRGQIRCESGVRIGGARDELEIGGLDNPVVRERGSDEPYLPGSSLKGRMRSLLERDLELPLIGTNADEPHGCGKPNCLFCRVFGPHKNTKHTLGPSRIIVRDAYLSPEWSTAFQKHEREILEVRTENMVNRLSNTAAHPRPVERVTRGVTFDLLVTLRVLNGDPEKDMLQLVARGLELLEQDGVGGGISRGHGQISITISEPQPWPPTS